MVFLVPRSYKLKDNVSVKAVLPKFCPITMLLKKKSHTQFANKLALGVISGMRRSSSVRAVYILTGGLQGQHQKQSPCQDVAPDFQK